MTTVNNIHFPLSHTIIGVRPAAKAHPIPVRFSVNRSADDFHIHRDTLEWVQLVAGERRGKFEKWTPAASINLSGRAHALMASLITAAMHKIKAWNNAVNAEWARWTPVDVTMENGNVYSLRSLTVNDVRLYLIDDIVALLNPVSLYSNPKHAVRILEGGSARVIEIDSEEVDELLHVSFTKASEQVMVFRFVTEAEMKMLLN